MDREEGVKKMNELIEEEAKARGKAIKYGDLARRYKNLADELFREIVELKMELEK